MGHKAPNHPSNTEKPVMNDVEYTQDEGNNAAYHTKLSEQVNNKELIQKSKQK